MHLHHLHQRAVQGMYTPPTKYTPTTKYTHGGRRRLHQRAVTVRSGEVQRCLAVSRLRVEVEPPLTSHELLDRGHCCRAVTAELSKGRGSHV